MGANLSNDLRFEVQDEAMPGTRIKVIGVGGGGCNAVARMLADGVSGVEFYVLNTDVQALQASPVPNKLAIGRKVTNGLGAGADPSIGRLAALEDTERIIEILEGADMVFVTAGMGGGTGTGAAPVIAALAKEMNALTIAVVTKPFGFEGPRRMKQADKGLADLASSVDTVISVPNDKLLKLVPKGTGLTDSFRIANDVLRQAVQGIADIITTPGMINRDFSDIRAIMLGMGFAIMGTASAKGEGALMKATAEAIECTLLEEGGVRGARGLLVNVTASSKLTLHEVNEACSLIRAAAEYDDAQMSFGIVLDESLDDQVKITVIATGFQRHNQAPPDRLVPAFSDDWSAPRPTAASLNEAFEPEEPVRATNSFDPEETTSAPELKEEIFSPVNVLETPAQTQDDVEMPAFLRRNRRFQ